VGCSANKQNKQTPAKDERLAKTNSLEPVRLMDEGEKN